MATTNQVTQRMAWALKKASKASDAPIWARLARLALKPGSARRVVNLNHLDKETKDGDLVAVPGKVLATGTISHKITLAAFSMSDKARTKATESGCTITTLEQMAEQNPTGKGVAIIG